MANAIDITNQKFGKLLVLKRAGSVNNRATQTCLCDCGNQIDVIGSDLRRGRKKDCGCTMIEKRMSLQNQQFGKLIALYPTEKRDSNGAIIQHCKCECGNECDVSSCHLKSGNTQSCGCTKIKKLIDFNHTQIKDLTNQKFGELIALYQNGANNNKNIIQHCKCSCGNECNVPSADLISGNTKSCGCKKNISYGEKKIAEILNNNNIKFKKEYVINNEELSFKGRFDFYLPDYNCFIEYDGIQHFQMGKGKFDNPQKFKLTKQHDEEKNSYCKNHNIFLIRIPYIHYENISINDLLPQTSEYLLRY